MTGRAVELAVKGGVAHVTWAQPERGNPFDPAFCAQLCEAAIECDESPEVRAVLIRAEGRFFSVGADLKWFGADRDQLPRRLKAATADLHMAIARFARCDAPVVAAVGGPAVGGSVTLTAMADFALAARSATFYAAFTAIGFVSDAGGTWYLPRRVGSRRAADFILLNQRWSAEEAAAYGLVSSVVDDDRVEAEALALAERLAAGPTRTYGEMKRLFISSSDTPLETQLELEARAIARTGHTADAWNAIQSVLAKQQPTFEGR